MNPHYPLTKASILPAWAVEHLAGRGIHTVEELLGATAAPEAHRAVAHALGVSDLQLETWLAALAALLPPEEAARLRTPAPPQPRGVWIPPQPPAEEEDEP